MSAQKQKNKKTKKTKKKTYFKKPKNLTFNSSSFELLHIIFHGMTRLKNLIFNSFSFELLHIIFHGTTMAKPVNFFP